MLANPHATFIMLSLCYAQCPSYLLHIIFLFLGILQHYVEYDSHTIVTLKKYWVWDLLVLQWVIWLIVRSFYMLLQESKRPFFSGLTCCPYLLNMLRFDCFCICHSFPIDFYFFDAVANVEIDIFPFQLALQDTQTLLP